MHKPTVPSMLAHCTDITVVTGEHSHLQEKLAWWKLCGNSPFICGFIVEKYVNVTFQDSYVFIPRP